MTFMQVNMLEAKTKLSQLVEAAERGEEVVSVNESIGILIAHREQELIGYRTDLSFEETELEPTLMHRDKLRYRDDIAREE